MQREKMKKIEKNEPPLDLPFLYTNVSDKYKMQTAKGTKMYERKPV